MTDTALVPIVESTRVELGVIRADSPAQLVHVATQAADALAQVIKAKKLFSNIQGKEYVRVEGWTTLATMMGCLPREVSMTRDEKGTYTATVELVRMHDGAVLTRASAECGMDEPTWKSRPDYARRSMAATRAVSKACRLAFSWVMVLAGYEATPSEEIPHEPYGVPGGNPDSHGVVPKEAERGGTSTGPKSKGLAGAGSHPAPMTPLRASDTTPLSQKPRALEAPEPDPLKGEDLDPPTWPFGSERGRTLKSYDSDALVLKRNWLVKKSRKPEEFAELVDAIDTELSSREGL